MRFLLLFVLGCSGQLAGGNDAAGTDSGSGGDGSIILPSPTDVCDGDPMLTGNHVLSIMNPYYAATYTPSPGNGSPTPLEMFLSVSGSPVITCHPHVVSNGGPPDLPASITVAVQAQFATQDKTFSESFPATVELSAVTNSQSLGFAGVEPVSAIQGTFKPSITGTWASHQLSFGGTLVETATDGGPASSSGNVTEQAFNSNMGQVKQAGSWM